MQKVCAKCQKKKETGCFYKQKRRSDGLNIYCKECSTCERNKWRKANPVKNAAAAKKWYYANKEKAAESNRRTNAKYSKEQVTAWKIKSYRKSSEELSDSYVSKLIYRNGIQIPLIYRHPEMIKLKRLHILTIRKLKQAI